jgi:hypothetical protein
MSSADLPMKAIGVGRRNLLSQKPDDRTNSRGFDFRDENLRTAIAGKSRALVQLDRKLRKEHSVKRIDHARGDAGHPQSVPEFLGGPVRRPWKSTFINGDSAPFWLASAEMADPDLSVRNCCRRWRFSNRGLDRWF